MFSSVDDRHPMKVLRADQYATVPWKNGGGATREIAVRRDPRRHNDFLWRLSIATIARSGPFSRFDGVDRTIAVVEGDGVVLRSSAYTKIVKPDTPPLSFSGETEIACELIGGSTVDLNVMTRRGFFDHVLRQERLVGWITLECTAYQTFVVSNGLLELSSRGRGSLRRFDTIAEIACGSACELYADKPTDIFIVELTPL